VETERDHLQQEQAVELQEAARQPGAQQELEQERRCRAGVKPRASLAARQNHPTRRPGMGRILTADQAEHLR
jgi:hypothetical protein